MTKRAALGMVLAAVGVAGAGLVGGGCKSPTSTTPGNLARVQYDSDSARAGGVYLLRGWIGIFSQGIDSLGARLESEGVRASVYQEAQWQQLAERIVRVYSEKQDHEPLVLIGHSYGADSAVRIARRLREENITVDLLVTLDPVQPPEVPPNVVRAYNLYQSNGVMDAFPWLRGIPMQVEAGSPTELSNMDIRTQRPDLLVPGLDHFNIEKQPLIRDDIVAVVKQVCEPREMWVSSRLAAGRRRVPAVTTRATSRPSASRAPGPAATGGGK